MASPKYPKVAGYELVKSIGGGGFSKVFQAVNTSEERIAACKVVYLTGQTSDKERKVIEKEMRIHAALKHEHVLRFINAIVVELKHKEKFIPGIYILMELAAGGDLFDKIAPEVGLADDVAHYYFNQLISGMDYIHAQGVCHRDLKPENLLLDIAGRLKISDFGLSAVYKIKETGKTRTLTERCGSLPYVAPELNSDEPYKAEPVDVWGMGVILFTMLTGITPWDEPTGNSPEFRRYTSGEIFDEDPWYRIPEEPLSLICGMLTLNPEDRLTLSDVFQHHWVMRPSQLASQGPTMLAERLTESLRTNGDLDLASPQVVDSYSNRMDEDGDAIMYSSTSHQSQFTQSLMLFSQTQGGNRYTPSLTRFYTSLGPSLLITLIKESLTALGVEYKAAKPPVQAGATPGRQSTSSEEEGPGQGPEGPYTLRIGGYDHRKVRFLGRVVVEKFVYQGGEVEGSFVIMTRDVGNPISWRQLWKALILSPSVEPHVLRKK